MPRKPIQFLGPPEGPGVAPRRVKPTGFSSNLFGTAAAPTVPTARSAFERPTADFSFDLPAFQSNTESDGGESTRGERRRERRQERRRVRRRGRRRLSNRLGIESLGDLTTLADFISGAGRRTIAGVETFDPVTLANLSALSRAFRPENAASVLRENALGRGDSGTLLRVARMLADLSRLGLPTGVLDVDPRFTNALVSSNPNFTLLE